jgi:hypothetical protein
MILRFYSFAERDFRRVWRFENKLVTLIVVPTFLVVAVKVPVNLPSLKFALYARLFYFTLEIT